MKIYRWCQFKGALHGEFSHWKTKMTTILSLPPHFAAEVHYRETGNHAKVGRTLIFRSFLGLPVGITHF